MITTRGKAHIKRYLAGLEPSIAKSIIFGIGSRAESVNDTAMHFEVDRAEVTLVSYDFANDKLVFKADVPATYDGLVYEIGLTNSLGSGSPNSKMLTTFSTITENWMTGTSPANFVTTNTRIGNDALRHLPSANESTTSTLNNTNINLSSNIGSDVLTLAYYNNNTNTSSVDIRLKSSDTNYFQYTITSPPAGYGFITWTRSAFTTTGTPDWSNITSIDIITNASSAGAASMQYDAIRIDDSTSENLNATLISRKVLGTVFTKNNQKTQEIEFSMSITI